MTDLYAVPSVVESLLSRTFELPSSSPPTPWRVRAQITMWAGRGVRGAAGVLPDALGDLRSIALTSGAFIRCLESPVGPYQEVWASPVLVWSRGPCWHLPFIAVDSVDSVRAGRELWALPKTMASFEGQEAIGDGWRVRASSVARGPELPLWGRSRCVQVRSDGALVHFQTRVRGRVRLCRVQLDTEGPTFQHWLPSGPRWGVQGELTLHLGLVRQEQDSQQRR